MVSPTEMSPPVSKEQRVWIRWLHGECLLPLEHVADVLGLDLAAVAVYVAWKPRNGGNGRRPQGPPRYKRSVRGRRGIAILGQTGSKIRRLCVLGYQPTVISLALAIGVDDVRDFVRRLEPIRRARLSRPRGRTEQIQIRTPPPRFVPPSLEPIAPGWQWRARPTDVDPPAAAPFPFKPAPEPNPCAREQPTQHGADFPCVGWPVDVRRTAWGTTQINCA